MIKVYGAQARAPAHRAARLRPPLPGRQDGARRADAPRHRGAAARGSGARTASRCPQVLELATPEPIAAPHLVLEHLAGPTVDARLREPSAGAGLEAGLRAFAAEWSRRHGLAETPPRAGPGARAPGLRAPDRLRRRVVRLRLRVRLHRRGSGRGAGRGRDRGLRRLAPARGRGARSGPAARAGRGVSRARAPGARRSRAARSAASARSSRSRASSRRCAAAARASCARASRRSARRLETLGSGLAIGRRSTKRAPAGEDGRHVAAVGARDRARDRQAQAGARAAAGARRVEALEHALELVGRQARTGVFDRDLGRVRPDGDADRDLAAARRVAERVVEQVQDRLPDLIGVGVDECALAAALERDAAVLGDDLEVIDERVRVREQVEPLGSSAARRGRPRASPATAAGSRSGPARRPARSRWRATRRRRPRRGRPAARGDRGWP